VRVVYNHLPKIAAAIRPAAARAVAKAAFDIEGRAKTLAPVDTGALRGSIAAQKVSDLAWRVSVGQEYGIYQEFGTRFMPAQPFLLPAAQAVGPSFLAAMRQLVGS
jgi:HK97 gp10 family phage protein